MMSPALHAAANALCERLRSAGAGSFMATEEQHAALATSFGLPLPQWLSALLQNYSLCGAELFWQAYPPEDDFDGRSYIILADPGNMVVESTELTPGCDILPLGFVCIAADGDGIGDPISSLWIKKTRPCIRSITTILRRSTRSGRTRGDWWPTISPTF